MEHFREVTRYSLFEQFIASNPSIKFVRHLWQDYSGVLRQRFVTIEHCQKIHRSSEGYGVGPVMMYRSLSIADFNEAPRQELVKLIPDWSSLRVCHFSPGDAWVMCFAFCEEEVDPLYQCPRYLLSKVLHRVEEENDFKLLFGCEIEFVLLDEEKEPPKSIDSIADWNTTAGLRDKKLALMKEVVGLLHESGIGVTHFHTESRHQLEISTDPFEPMEAADHLLYTHELIRCVSLRYGFQGTVAVKPTLQNCPTSTNGLHFSINGADQETRQHFLAGILKRLPLLVPFSMPTFDSYRRETIDRKGTWISWGTENRDVAIRAITSDHWEYRLLDCHANIFMVLAIMLDSGLNGIRDKEPLVWKDVRYVTSQMTPEELEVNGITERLHSNSRDALDLLQKSRDLDVLLGEGMKRLYVRVRQVDETALSQMNDDDRRKRYLLYF